MAFRVRLRQCLISAPIASRQTYHARTASSTAQSHPAASRQKAPELPPCNFRPDKYEGMSYERMLEVRGQHLPGAMLTYYKRPVAIHQGHMQYLWDVDGRRYLDMFAGIVTVSIGHCHPKAVEVGQRQMEKLWHTTNIYLHPQIHEYAEKLAAKMPGDLKVVYFTNSGSEANDLALLMARLYTGAYEAVSLRNAFHGASPTLMGVTALSTWRYNTPTGFGIHQAMNPDVFRGPWGGSNCRDSVAQTTRTCECGAGECQAAQRYAEQLEEVLLYSMPKGRVAALYAEPIQGVGGAVQLPRGYLKKAYQMVRERGGLCISDEVQTGFGRLGSHYWGFQTQDVVPDIVTLAKGIGNGIPLAAVVTSQKVADVMKQALHFNTYGGNPISCAVGSAVLDVIEEEGLQRHCEEVGTHLLRELLKLRDEFDIVGDVRGKGLMVGLELVTDKASKKPLPAEHVNAIFEDTKDMGLLVGKGGLYGNTFRLKPPMCITREDADFAVSVLRRALENFK